MPIKILVTAKRVEDYESKIKVNPAGNGILPDGLKYKINPFDEIGVEEALRLVARKGIQRRTGARGLRSIIEGLLLDTMFDLPSMKGITEVVVDRDVVEGRKEPVRVFADKDEKAEDAA